MKMIHKIATIAAMTLILAFGSTQLVASMPAGTCPATECDNTCKIDLYPSGTCYSGGSMYYVYSTYGCAVTSCYSSEYFPN